MRNRRPIDRGWSVGARRLAGRLGLWLWAKATRRPVNGFAVLGAVAATLVIIVNAVFLQSGSHPAPFFANSTPQPAPFFANSTLRQATPESTERTAPPSNVVRSIPLSLTPQTVAARRSDPIAELIGQSARIKAVQRILAEFGYGQLKPSGTLDAATVAAIQKFERERRLPVTGQVSERLIGELSVVTGRSLQ